MSDIHQLQEDIAKAALQMPSALTPAYKATLDAVDYLESHSITRATDRLKDAALQAKRVEDVKRLEELAERCEGLES